MYRNARDFCLNFVSCNFTVNSLISSSNFLVAPLGFSMCRIMSSANSESFVSSFPIWIHLVSFSSLIAVAKTSEAILNNSGESEHPCLVADLRGNSLFFTIKKNVCLEFVIYGLYYVEVGSCYAHFLVSSILNGNFAR